MRLHVDLDAEPWRFVDQQTRRADAALAEMEVVADRDPGDSEPPDQIMVNEILRRGAGTRLVEGHDHGAGKPGAGQQPKLGGLVAQAELRNGRGEEPARMRLEGERQRGAAVEASHLECCCDHRAVAEMDAVEIAHRHHRPPRDRLRRRGVADHGESGHFSLESSAGMTGRTVTLMVRTKSSREIGVRYPFEVEGYNRTTQGQLTPCLRPFVSRWSGLRGPERPARRLLVA